MRVDDASCRLAVYGTLAPGRQNHWVLEGLKGTWMAGMIRGHLHPEGWGATAGYPALLYDESGPEMEVQVFESPDLPKHWARIDAFEGSQYRRTRVSIVLSSGLKVQCHIYELNRRR